MNLEKRYKHLRNDRYLPEQNNLAMEVKLKGLEDISALLFEIKELKAEIRQLIERDKKKVYTIKEVAEKLSVSVGTINNRISVGKISCMQDTVRGVRTISSEEIERYLTAQENKF
ncbi:MAG: helix-turn-helix domain-containing protein [Sporocytophaga sp.]|uniref:helix-turn-helix domain-containing protein n=1 Tax=Sporocytophaga sp. TaxID=2231183 RepID=UPI001B2F341B|nr:helix-turn-helix domain-containing protein [Sporocytophaga sp.]MBO9703664.1 helix-turn-helix domain-containing protein [Sporocytophaga sp.]